MKVEQLDHMTVTEVLDAFTVMNPRGRRFRMETRPVCGLSFCETGRITYTHRGKEYVSLPGTVLLLPAGASYELYSHEDGVFPLIQFACAEGRGFSEFELLPIASFEAYRQDYQRLKQLLSAGNGRLSALALLYDMLARIRGEGEAVPASLPLILAYIEEHLSESTLSNTVLAAQAGISEVYLRRLFAAHCQTTPRQYVIARRLLRARELLLETRESVEAIASGVGFASIYHFTRAFRQKNGMTPTEYRRRFRMQAI